MARATPLEAAVQAASLPPPAFELIRLDLVKPSPLNPRKTFDVKKHAELVESVRTKGVIVPVMVRQHQQPSGAPYFEIVYGERRYRAAMDAGLSHLPALVRQLEDREVLELALTENVARNDMTPLEEGLAFKRLVSMGRTAEELAQLVGREKGTVYARMKLADLQGEARAAVEKGELAASIGVLIARLPTQEMQNEAFEALEQEAWDGLENLTFSVAQNVLTASFKLALKDAPFEPRDERLLPSAGSCLKCPTRTGATPELFKDVKNDTCLNTACWKQKVAANVAVQKAKYSEKAEKGAPPVLPAKALKDPQYVDLEKEIWSWDASNNGKAKVKEILGKEAPETAAVVIDGEGRAHMLVRADDARAALKKLGKEKLAPSVAPKPSREKNVDYEAEERKRKEGMELREKVATQAIQRIVAKVESSKETAASFLRELLLVLVDNAVDTKLLQRRAWKDTNALLAAAKKMSELQLRALVLELAMGHDTYDVWRNYSDVLEDTAGRYGIDLKKLEAAEKVAAEKPDEKKPGKSVRCDAEGCKRAPIEGRAGPDQEWKACEEHAPLFKRAAEIKAKAKKGRKS